MTCLKYHLFNSVPWRGNLGSERSPMEGILQHGAPSKPNKHTGCKPTDSLAAGSAPYLQSAMTSSIRRATRVSRSPAEHLAFRARWTSSKFASYAGQRAQNPHAASVASGPHSLSPTAGLGRREGPAQGQPQPTSALLSRQK